MYVGRSIYLTRFTNLNINVTKISTYHVQLINKLRDKTKRQHRFSNKLHKRVAFEFISFEILSSSLTELTVTHNAPFCQEYSFKYLVKILQPRKYLKITRYENLIYVNETINLFKITTEKQNFSRMHSISTCSKITL